MTTTTSKSIWVSPDTKKYLEMLKDYSGITMNDLITLCIPYMNSKVEEISKAKSKYEARMIANKHCNIIRNKAKEKLEGKAEVLGNEDAIAQST